MINTLKNSGTVVLSIAALLMWSLFSCGTEIGNGSPEQGEEKQQGDGDDNDNSLESASSSDDDSLKAPFEEGSDAFNTNLLVVECGSPFGEALTQIELSVYETSESETPILKAAKSDDVWTIENSSESITAELGENISTVTLKNSDDELISTGYTCSEIATVEDVNLDDEAGSYTKRTVTVTKDDVDTIVSWYLSPESEEYELKGLTVVLLPDEPSEETVSLVIE